MTTQVSSINSTTTPTQVVASNGDRISVQLENNDINRAYILVGAPADVGTVSASNYTFSLVENASADIDAPEVYDEMWIVWAGDSTGALQVTETISETSVGANDANLGDMKNRIASDLERTLTDTTHVALARTWDDEIEDAILDSIQLYRSRPFWFLQEPNAVSLTSTTSTGNSYVSDYPGLIRLDSLRITINGQRYQLREISFTQMESRFDGVTTDNQPYEYSRFGGRVRIYPTPNDAYTLTWSGIFEDSALTGNEISNGWMTHGQLLIRASAKLILLRDYIKSYEDVPAAQQALDNAEKALYREHVMRTSSKRIARRI